jgi:hypothetical protein
VLRYPGAEHRRPSELAADARMTKQAMNYLLGQMQRLGYLTRDDDPDDQRFKRVTSPSTDTPPSAQSGKPSPRSRPNWNGNWDLRSSTSCVSC